MAAERVSFQK